MRRAIVVVSVVTCLLASPLAEIASAGIVCNLQEKLGVDNVKDCESQP